MILVARGNHTHHPPPPSKLPQIIANEMMEIMMSHDILNLTARSLMLSPKFDAFIKKYSKNTLREMHSSLHVEDRVSALIRKQRLLAYPGGTDIAGVLREFEFDQEKKIEEQWIRDVHFFNDNHEHFMIICCIYE